MTKKKKKEHPFLFFCEFLFSPANVFLKTSFVFPFPPFILMYIGAYEILLDGIVSLDLMVLIPVGAGFVLSIILFAKLISLLFKRIYGYTYYTVLGFVLGSIIAIFPGIAFDFRYLISMLLFVLGFYVSFTLSRQLKEE